MRYNGTMAKNRKVKWAALLLAALLLGGCTKGGSGIAAPPPGGAAFRADSSDGGAGVADIRLGVVLPAGEDAFTQEAVRQAGLQLEELAQRGGFGYELATARDGQAALEAVQDALAERPDAVLLWPPYGQSWANAAEAVQAAGAKLVLYGDAGPAAAPAAAIMGDDATIGSWTADYIHKHFGPRQDGPEVGILRFTGDDGPQSAARSAGLDSLLAELGEDAGYRMLAPDVVTGWQPGEARDAMAAWLYQASPAELAALRVVVAQDDALVEGIVEAVEAWLAENPGSLNLELICGVGGRRETLDLFWPGVEGQPAAGGAAFLTYYYSPSFLRQAVLLAEAAARGGQYQGQDLTGQSFTIPSFEIDRSTQAAYRASREYAERYG